MMSSVSQRIVEIRHSLPSGVELCAVSKTKPVALIEEAYQVGQRIFGENRVQELEEKANLLPKDIQWHLIGHLQTNKVKYIASFVSMIHAVDDEKLLEIIDKEARKHNRIIDCLIQIHIAEEESKFGFSEEEALQFFQSGKWKSLKNVQLRGLMGMATFTEDSEKIRMEFRGLHHFFLKMKSECMSQESSFDQLSIGMSGDYKIAIDEGSTLIRVGSSIFGDRSY